MSTFTHPSTNPGRKVEQSGSVLVISIIVLVILGALGIAALDVADLNIFISANDRDAKESFFHADSGVNMGHEFLEESLDARNSTFFGSDANLWRADCANFIAANFPFRPYGNGTVATFVRSGLLDRESRKGTGMGMAQGYESSPSAARLGTEFTYLVRSHREGQRNSRATVDLGWLHVPR